MQLPFHRITIDQGIITVTILCPNAIKGKPHEIYFNASFQAMSQIPIFMPIIRCPTCGQYFLDEDDNCCSIEPGQGLAVCQWWERAANITRRIEEDRTREVFECYMETVRIPILKRNSEKSGKKREKVTSIKYWQREEFDY